MKKYLFVFVLVLLPTFSFAQRNDTTKIEKFISKTGQIIKFTDYNLPEIQSQYVILESKIRTIESADETAHFYQIVKDERASAFIAEEDLVELIKALKSLKQSVIEDAQSFPDYMENKFVTNDGLQVGYYIIEGKAKWFIILEQYGSDSTVTFNDVNTIERSFVTALEKIRDLSKKSVFNQ